MEPDTGKIVQIEGDRVSVADVVQRCCVQPFGHENSEATLLAKRGEAQELAQIAASKNV